MEYLTGEDAAFCPTAGGTESFRSTGNIPCSEKSSSEKGKATARQAQHQPVPDNDKRATMSSPYMTFTISGTTITALDAQGNPAASLAVHGSGKSFHLLRDGKTIATSSHHRVSGTTDLTIHGQQVTMRQSWEGMRSGKDISAPMGKYVWRTGGSMLHATEELTEEATGTKVASCRIPSFRRGDGKLVVLAPREDSVVDLAVASWVVLLDG